MVIFLGSEVRILCEVRIEEILCPSGSFFLQLPNGTVITEIISASMSIIELNIAATSLKDFGRYYCNISIISPQFPNIGLRAFEGLQLQSKLYDNFFRVLVQLSIYCHSSSERSILVAC